MMARPPAVIAHAIHVTSPALLKTLSSGSWATKIRMASAFTKPVITDFETNRITEPTLSSPKMNWITPVSTVAAKRYSTPWNFTRVPTSSAIAAVAAEIIAGRPPAKAVMTAMVKEA